MDSGLENVEFFALGLPTLNKIGLLWQSKTIMYSVIINLNKLTTMALLEVEQTSGISSLPSTFFKIDAYQTIFEIFFSILLVESHYFKTLSAEAVECTDSTSAER